jgi:hypothetical protein
MKLIDFDTNGELVNDAKSIKIIKIEQNLEREKAKMSFV